MKRKIRYAFVIILIIIMIIVAGSYIFRYHVKPVEIYLIDSENLIDDGGFENFNMTPGDCCNSTPGDAKIYASESNDVFIDNHSLNLTAENHCACINKPIINFSNLDLYLLSFYFKGDNPRFCNYVSGENRCLPEYRFDLNQTWNKYQSILQFTNLSIGSLIHLYADSRGEPVTNLYDDLQVHRLDPISYDELLELESINSDFSKNAPELAENNTYIILTKKDNLVRNGEFLSDSAPLSGFAYYLISGKPEITLKFPLTEIIILVIMMLIVIKLLFKKSEEEIHESIARELRRDIEKAIKFHGR